LDDFINIAIEIKPTATKSIAVANRWSALRSITNLLYKKFVERRKIAQKTIKKMFFNGLGKY
jgi:hypothetical protein